MIIDIFLKTFRSDPTVKRHLLKTVSWRIIGSIDTALLGWLISGEIDLGVKIGMLEMGTKMLLYFAHERAWHRIKFGLPSRTIKAEKVRQENIDNLFLHAIKVKRQQREKLSGHRSFTIWLTGLSASGKSTIASELDSWFYKKGFRSYVIDGDNTRLGINNDLSFSKEDRSENIRRVAEICKLLNDAGIITIASFISPFESDRNMAKKIIGRNDVIEVFTDAGIDTCKARDVKGLYNLAEAGKIRNFTGIDSPYEPPASPDIHLHTDTESVSACVHTIINYLTAHEWISVGQLSLMASSTIV